MENNQMLNFIYARRSCRDYKDTPLTAEQIENILMAGDRAPTSKAIYPWHFIVITDKSIMAEIQKVHNMSKSLETAPAVIITCGEMTKSWVAWRDDCAAATLNMIYAAQAQGLASCWHGIYPRDNRVEPIRELLNIPKDIMPYSMLTVGYSKREKPPQSRFDRSKIHLDNSW